MNLGLQLIGGLMKRGGSSDPVVGQGEVVAMPAMYYSDEYINGTGIIFDGFTYTRNPDGKQAPFAFIVKPVIRVAGVRGLSFLPLNPLLDCLIYIDVTYADGSRISYDATELWNEYTKEYDDPYFEIGNLGAIFLRDAGIYKIEGTAYLARSDGQCWKATYSETFELTKHSGVWEYYDIDNGSSGNDGLQPLPQVTVDYDEDTGILSGVGQFAGITLSDEPYLLNSNRWLRFPTFGRVALKQIIDDDTAEVEPYYKLGSNQTGLVSSTGPKALSDFESNLLQNSGDNNKLMFIAGNGDYTRTNWLYVRTVTGTVGVVGYAGKPTINRSTQTTDPTAIGQGQNNLLYYGSTSSTVSNPDQIWISNIKFDGQEKNGCLSSNPSSLNPSNDAEIVTDRVEAIRSNANSAVGFQASGNILISHYGYCDNLNNKRTNVEVLSPAGELTAGDGTIQVSAPIPSNVDQHALIKIEEGGVTEYRRSGSWTGDTFTLDYFREDDKTSLQNSFTAAATITVSDEKSIVLFESVKRHAWKGIIFYGDGDIPTYDHHSYGSVKYGDNYIKYCRALEGSERMGYMFNFNYDDTSETYQNISNASIAFNHLEKDSANFFLDTSNGLNGTKYGMVRDITVFGNTGSPNIAPYYGYTALEVFMKYNNFWHADGRDYPFFVMNEGASNEEWNDQSWSWRLHSNKAYGFKLAATQTSNENPFIDKFYQNNFELVDNEVYYLGTQYPVNMGKDEEYATSTVVRNNNVYAPNRVGDLFRLDRVDMDLATFNAAVGDTNYSQDPGWTDPANGDFSTEVTTYFTDFSGDTVGQLPAGTALRRSGEAGDYLVVDLSGTKAVEFDALAGSGNPHALSFTALACEGDTEAYTLLRDINSNPTSARLILFAQDSPQNEYGCNVSSLNNNVILYRRVSGSYTALATVGKTIDSTLQYHVTFKVTPGTPNQLEAYVWEDGDSKPVSPTITATDSTYTTPTGYAGFIGFNVNDANPVYYYRYGLGINGTPAPTE